MKQFFRDLSAEDAKLAAEDLILFGRAFVREVDGEKQRVEPNRIVLADGALVSALRDIEAVSDNCINAERYTTADALVDLQEIRNIIKRYKVLP